MAPATQPARVVAADLACADTLPKIEGMIMENTNDKTAVQMPEPDCAGDYCHNVLVYTVDETELIAATRAEEARRKAADVIAVTNRQLTNALAHVERLELQLAQRTAGGDAGQRLAQFRRWLADTGALPRGSSWVGELEAIVAGRGEPVAEAAAQADDGERMSTDEARAYLIGFMKQHFTDKTYDRYILADRSSNGLAGDFAWQMANALRRIFAAPTAQPTPKLDDIEQYRIQMAAISTASFGYWKEGAAIHPDYDTVPLRDVARLYAKYEALHAAQPTPDEQPVTRVDRFGNETRTWAAQPTPPDDEPMTGATAPGWVAGRATPLDLLQRYGFDGTLGGDFDENADGPYVKLEDVRAALRQPGAPADSLAQLRALIANDGYAISFCNMRQYRTALLKAADTIRASVAAGTAAGG